MNIILVCLALKYQGDWDKIYNALEQKEKVTIEKMTEVEMMLKKENLKVITILDQDYPNALKAAFKPPFVLWLKGDIAILKQKILCLAGNQDDEITKTRVQKFLPELEKLYLLTNPNFKGIDREIINKSTSPLLYISACGNEKSNFPFKKGDLMISEYPNQASPSIDKFRNRNRIIAAFAKSLILFSSQKNGPINHLVTAFLNQGKEIYCFAGDGGINDGNSELIKQGANLITSIQDLKS